MKSTEIKELKLCKLCVQSTRGYKKPAVHVQYARTILMMKFASRAVYADPRVRVKREVYFGPDSLMRRSEERSVFRADPLTLSSGFSIMSHMDTNST